jgi:CheY-like chemotaxis protein
LLNDALTIIHVRIKEKPVRLISEIDPALPAALEGDETRVRQILLNLLSNAAKYTGEGFVKFSASGERIGDGIKLTFRVADSGTGIKPEDVGKLFGNFVRVDQDRNTSVEGSGLGLAIARNLCRAMGGDITVESEYGKGSVFTASIIQMIADDRPIGDIGGRINAVPRYADVRFTAPGVRVLLVDDIETNLMVIKGLLAPYEMDVSACLSGREAIDLVGRESFDIVFMDHMMPEMDGIETAEAIRATRGEYFKAVPIIALTANAISGMREMFLRNGFNDYLAKPIEIPKLSEIMERWVPKEKRRAKIDRGSKTSSSQAETDLNIEGLDTPRGLASTGGTVEGYIKVLETYCRDAEKRIEILAGVPDGIGSASFITQVHALKSASASIGAAELSRAAAALESAGDKGDMEFIRVNLDSFLEGLIAMTERIKTALSRKTVISPNGKRPGMSESLNLLKDALASEDIGDVDKILAGLSGEPLDEATRDLLSRISDLVLVGEFKEALSIAENIAE